jgi:hypothetical protein
VADPVSVWASLDLLDESPIHFRLSISSTDSIGRYQKSSMMPCKPGGTSMMIGPSSGQTSSKSPASIRFHVPIEAAVDVTEVRNASATKRLTLAVIMRKAGATYSPESARSRGNQTLPTSAAVASGWAVATLSAGNFARSRSLMFVKRP